MFIKKITIQNFRLFSGEQPFEIDRINIPDSITEGSGLTLFVGENGCGKTTLLDAIALPILTYKAEIVSLNDFNHLDKDIEIKIFAGENFSVDGTMPKVKFKAKGFSFKANLRKKDSNNYLSSLVVSDQKYIKADGEAKPNDSSPDLRVNVNNPFKGLRFNENDILFLDKSRIFQTRFGTYNATRFDRLMEDFDFQYIKDGKEDIDGKLDEIKKRVDNSFLAEAIGKFEKISGKIISLNIINNYQPFHKSFFAEKKSNYQQIPINMLGSGYEMIFSLIYAFYLSKQSKKQLIILIDEPELHLHPALQESFAKLLLDFSKSTQIILTTHSPLLVKQLFFNKNIEAKVISNGEGVFKILSIQDKILPYISANEINYLAFGLATEEYHNELYGFLQEREEKYKDEELDKFLETKNIARNKKWIKKINGKPNSEKNVTLQTYIRHSIHHPENKINILYSPEELLSSIKQMIRVLKDNADTSNRD